MKNKNLSIKVASVTLVENLLLVIFKLIAGILSASFAMIADALHSLSDVLSTIIVMIGIKIANKKADNNHNYGHDRFECVSAIILSIMLFITGLYVGLTSVTKMISKDFPTNSNLTILALIASIVSIVVKEAMYWYTRHYAIKEKSNALMADAWHHRSDALSSIGSLIGIVGVMVGIPILDSIFGLVIAMCIVQVSITIFIDSIRKMTDEAVDSKLFLDIKNIILDTTGVEEILSIKTRKFANKIFVEVQIECSKNLEFTQAHQIADNVQTKIKENFENVKECIVHYEPI